MQDVTPPREAAAHPSARKASDRLARVLLIEDNRGFAYLIRDVLTRQHRGQFEMADAVTLAQGLALLGQSEFDVILLDLGLPDSLRLETFSRTQARAPETPIIILTVLDDDEVAMNAMRAGAQDYLVKDQVNKDLLVRAIRYAVERARIEKAMRHLSGRLLQSQDEERRRIARALHDSTAQTLAALAMNLSLLTRLAPGLSPKARDLLAESREFVDACSSELRTMSYLLHPPLLDEVGLAGAVRDYADGFSDRSRLRVDLELPERMERLPKEMETTLFRVMQESLANIHRHSGSATASIRFALTREQIVLEVRDAGKGFPPELAADEGSVSGLGVGIAGMRERVRQLGGQLTIQTGPEGSIVTASLPLRGGAS